MILENYICKECMQIGTDAKDKKETLREIAILAKKSVFLKKHSEVEIFNSLLERENIGSTGFGNDIAIPHCSFDNLNDFIVGVLINKNGVDFKSLDKKKTKVFFFIIGPSKERNKHIQILSSISRLLKSEDNVNDIINASSNKELIEIISKSSDVKEKDITPSDNVIFHVLIQKEKYFDDILQIFSEVVDRGISVIETVNAGHFLHALPLFSTFWSEDKKTYSRVIIAIVDKKLSNNIIRRINTIVDNIEKESGVLVTANELFYTNGCIDF